MALLWMDGFDHYIAPGFAQVSKMLDGVYASLGTNTYYLDNAKSRTGSFSLRSIGANYVDAARRVFGSAKTTVGLGCAFWFDSLPSASDRHGIFMLCDTNNIPQVFLTLQPTGKLTVSRANGNGGAGTLAAATLCESADAAVVAGAFQHIEFKATAHQTAGTVEVRVNGVTVCSASGVDTVASALEEFSMMRLLSGYGSSGSGLQTGYTYMDDLFAWDSTGTQNNDFLGDRRVRTLFPDANTAVNNWTAVGAANAFDCINEASPNDETDYIEAAAATTPTSEFGMQDLPVGVGAVAALQVCSRVRKTNAGTADFKASLLSGASVSDGTNRPMTEAYTYWMDVHELDPATGTPWSEAAVNAMKLRVARTAA